MNFQINSNNYKVWLILLDILNKKPSLDNFRKNPPSETDVTLSFHTFDKPIGFSLCDYLEPKSKICCFEKLFIHVPFDFLENRIVISLGLLNLKDSKEIFPNVNNIRYKLNDIKKEMLWYVVNNNLFGENINTIFQNSISENLSIIRNPLFIYFEPIENIALNLWQNENIHDAINIINRLKSELKCHENLWLLLNHCLVLHPIFSDFWGSKIFVNLYKYKEKIEGNNIYMPRNMYNILKQYACYHLLSYRNKNMGISDLNQYDILNINKYNKFNDISKLQNEILTYSGYFNFTYVSLLNEIPLINKHQNILLNNICQDIKIEDTEKHFQKGFLMSERLINDVKEDIEWASNMIQFLVKKSELIIDVSRDKLNIIIASINLKLQYYMIILTVVITLLTIILAVESNFIKYIANKIIILIDYIYRYILSIF